MTDDDQHARKSAEVTLLFTSDEPITAKQQAMLAVDFDNRVFQPKPSHYSEPHRVTWRESKAEGYTLGDLVSDATGLLHDALDTFPDGTQVRLVGANILLLHKTWISS